MSRLKGFTLIELVITVAIIVILASIAYPSYQESVRKSRRADARNVLLQAAQWMERFYTENNRYDQNLAGTAVALPASLQTAPIEGATKFYNISLSANCTGAATVAANTFTLSACPIATSDQVKDKCQTLTLTNQGVKGTSSTLGADRCWL